MTTCATLCIALLMALTGAARAEENGQYENGESVILKPGMAYILFREIAPKESYGVDIVFVRLLDRGTLDGDIARLRKDPDSDVAPNVARSLQERPYIQAGEDRVYLLAVPAGTYLIGGQAFSAARPASMGTCMCLGTVGFDAKANAITDLGYVLAARDDKPTAIPELAGHVRGKAIGMAPTPFVLAVRPFTEGMAVPASLTGLARVSADYRAVGKFPNYFGGPIDRLIPMPGVLDYDKDGEVIDLRGGTAVTQKP